MLLEVEQTRLGVITDASAARASRVAPRKKKKISTKEERVRGETT